MNLATVTTASEYTLTITSETEGLQAVLGATSVADGIDFVHLRVVSDIGTSPVLFKLLWSHPVVDVHGFWRPSWSPKQDLWDSFFAMATSSVPVGSLFNISGCNRLTFALSDALNPTRIDVAAHEETASLHCSITFLYQPSAPFCNYEATLRLDTRDVPYYAALKEVQGWWAGLPGYQPAPVPEIARRPMYSTWYSFHQHVDAAEVQRQCQLAKALGCDAVIVDDGWQTANNQRGYAYCGDWQVNSNKIPDMEALVAAIHALGMKFILWYAVPFVGPYTRAWSRLEGKFLYVKQVAPWEDNIGVLDPRFPDVREYVIQTYVDALRAWDLDGFKLDFVDEFYVPLDAPVQYGQGRDYKSVPEAVDRLLTDIIERLREIKPDIMIEFRQTYIGPLMRKYGNMFRAADCPIAAAVNRVRTLDVRLLCGSTAAHADMFLWRADEPVHSAAQHFIATLFAVPQVSVLLDQIPPDHQEMVRFWLTFWRDNRDVLLDGELMPLRPEMHYPIVIASTDRKRLIAMYQHSFLCLGAGVPEQLIVVNGTYSEKVVLDLAEDLGQRQLVVRNCRGHVVRDETITLNRGLHSIVTPASGVIFLTATP